MKHFIFFSLALLFSFSVFAQENIKKKAKLTEEQKIERLISDFSSIEGGIFIYNNHRVPIADAANYFHNKRQNLAKTKTTIIKDARTFIVDIASKSTNTGHLYEYENKEGVKAYVGDYMMARLGEIESE